MQAKSTQSFPIARVQIFDFSNPVSYLNAVLEDKKSRNFRFSIRAWAKLMGLSDAGPLSQILKSKRPVPAHYIEPIAKNLQLNREQQDYFSALVHVANAKTVQEREKFQEQANRSLEKGKLSVSYIDDFQLFSEPVHMVLLQMIELQHFRFDARWIQRQLRVAISIEEIEKIYGEFLRLGYAIESAGRLRLVHHHVHAQKGPASYWLRKFHENSLKQAASAIHCQSREEREYGSYIMSIKDSDLVLIKEEIRKFADSLIAKFSSQEKKVNSIYHLNVNFFAQTRKDP